MTFHWISFLIGMPAGVLVFLCGVMVWAMIDCVINDYEGRDGG